LHGATKGSTNAASHQPCFFPSHLIEAIHHVLFFLYKQEQTDFFGTFNFNGYRQRLSSSTSTSPSSTTETSTLITKTKMRFTFAFGAAALVAFAAAEVTGGQL
jgi:hypothetical protein